jgi:hypothetical protein
MSITLNDLTAISLCVVTQELLDTKRFQQNFCDNLLLRARDTSLEPLITPLKRDLNNPELQKKFFDGYKAAIINNIDKIIAIVSSRYSRLDMRAVEKIVANGKNLIKNLLLANNFAQIAELYPTFKSNITLPTYQLFSASMKV